MCVEDKKYMCCFGWTNLHYHVALSSLIDSKFNRRWKVTHNKIYVEDEQYICGDGRVAGSQQQKDVARSGW